MTVNDDHRYTSKGIIIGAIFFPYTIWIDGREVYRAITASSENLKSEK